MQLRVVCVLDSDGKEDGRYGEKIDVARKVAVCEGFGFEVLNRSHFLTVNLLLSLLPFPHSPQLWIYIFSSCLSCILSKLLYL